MKYPYRTIFKNQIVAEFFPPTRKTKKQKVIIFCPGAPSLPGKKSTIQHYAQLGYWSFSFRYRGSWESKGTFLKKSPHLDVKDIIDQLPKGFTDVWQGNQFKIQPEQIILIGTSFGGPAALLNSHDPRVDKVIAVSSVIDWTVDSKLEPLAKEYRIFKEGYPGAYRFSKSEWHKLEKGFFYNPIIKVNEIDGSKILLIHAQDDQVCLIKPVQEFSKLTGAKLKQYKRGGHGLDLIKGPTAKQILKFIQT